MAAINGFEEFSIISWTSNKDGPFGSLPNSDMSAPAIKVLPSHMITIAWTSLFSIAFLIPISKPSLTFADRALTGGEFKVRTPTLSITSNFVTSLIAVIFFPFTLSK